MLSILVYDILVRPGLAGNGPGVSPVCKTRRGRGSPALAAAAIYTTREYPRLFSGPKNSEDCWR